MKPNEIAVTFIQGAEDFRPRPYRDIAGVLTWGYGTTGPHPPDHPLTKEEAAQLVRDHLEEACKELGNSVKAPLSERQEAALLSFVYNEGVNALLTSTLLRRINAGDPGASTEFLKWDKAHIGGKLVAVTGLTNRRQREKHLFDSDPFPFNVDNKIIA